MFSPLSGATANSYTVPLVGFSDGGLQFKCVVTNKSWNHYISNGDSQYLGACHHCAYARESVYSARQNTIFDGHRDLSRGATQDITSQVSWEFLEYRKVATISISGVVTAFSTGTATIYATELGETGSTVATVPTLTSITVSPPTPIIAVGSLTVHRYGQLPRWSYAGSHVAGLLEFRHTKRGYGEQHRHCHWSWHGKYDDRRPDQWNFRKHVSNRAGSAEWAGAVLEF